jgi:hypothetical protein
MTLFQFHSLKRPFGRNFFRSNAFFGQMNFFGQIIFIGKVTIQMVKWCFGEKVFGQKKLVKDFSVK